MSTPNLDQTVSPIIEPVRQTAGARRIHTMVSVKGFDNISVVFDLAFTLKMPYNGEHDWY